MNPRSAVLIGVLALAPIATGQVIEDFEHGNEGLYGFAGTLVDNMSITPGAARAGVFGAEFGNAAVAAWRTRFDIPTSQGKRYLMFVRTRDGASSGRAYLGVGATASGAYSAVFAPNSNEIALQNNAGYSFVTVASAPFTPTSGTWYALELDWSTGGFMTVRLFNEAMTSLLASTATANTGYTTAGGLAVRGFTSTSSTNDIDVIGIVSTPCFPDCNGDGALNAADFGCFQTKFAIGDPTADCNIDGALNIADFGCFQSKFAIGCP